MCWSAPGAGGFELGLCGGGGAGDTVAPHASVGCRMSSDFVRDLACQVFQSAGARDLHARESTDEDE